MMQGHVDLEALTLDTMMGATANANIFLEEKFPAAAALGRIH